MNFDRMPTANAYAALTIVSPMMFGEDEKDQDRARWYGPGQIACVCDGVTSSPCSGEAAELVASHIPIMFDGNIKDKLQTICNLLMARRKEYQQSDMVFPDGTSPAMQDLLRKVMQEKQAISFQTTIVAAKLVCSEETVSAHILKCGDSAFFAFSNEGELLSSSLTNGPHSNRAAKDKPIQSSLFDEMSFGPGDQILVRIEGLLSNNKNLAQRTQIMRKHHKNWLVCTPIEICGHGARPIENRSPALRRLSLKPTDRLLVPRYLYGTQLTSRGKHYRVLDYSSTIRVISMEGAGAEQNQITQRGSTTMVLPDHFYRGYVESYEDRFPLGTQFVLCSDGFYSGFSDARCLWQWLRNNASVLSHKDERQPVLKRLHSQVNAKCSDDDISFVWAYPRKTDVPGLSRTQE